MNSGRATSRTAVVKREAAKRFQIPRSIAVVAFIVTGVWLDDVLIVSARFSLTVAVLALIGSACAARLHRNAAESFFLATALIGLGAALTAIRSTGEDARDISQLAARNLLAAETAIRVTGSVANIPALDAPPAATAGGASRPRQVRTLFLIHVKSCGPEDNEIPARGLCRVLVEGDATIQLKWGDQLELIGQLDLADPPMNPGEFDYQRHLQRNGISAMLFVKHPAALNVVRTTWWHPTAVMTGVRQQTVAALKKHLSPANRATAEALLLGNRGHLNPDLERDFIASGTMHLLAISGLHVGILYVFLVRVMNLLMAPRTQSLIIGGVVCVLYCFLTDLRPSVMRSTVFIVLHIVGQICVREMRIGSLIGVTAIVLVIWDPSIAFDVGAWLSFLCVAALGWVSERTPSPEDRGVPPEVFTWQDRLKDWRAASGTWLARCCQQVLAVTLLSAPLVATQFHVISLTGMVINILLIPFTTATLISGYLFIAIGCTVPPLGAAPGLLFGLFLSGLNAAVALSADVRAGFITIPDLPGWFLPIYYLLLAAAALASRPIVRQTLRLGLLSLVTLLFFSTSETPVSNDVTCTLLSVGHGNAAVLKLPNRKVVLFDAGALNRGDRTSDLVSRFLWHQGFRTIDAIVISHPDIDHFNAVVSLVDRIPVGQIVMTGEFAKSDAPEVQAVLNTASARHLFCTIAQHNDQLRFGEVTIDFLQARVTDDSHWSDNASSLVSLVSFAGRRICLPGDLEGAGQEQLLSQIPVCDVLVSPHHGSPAANPPELAEQVRPKAVIVSSRDSKRRAVLEGIYSDSKVLMTSEQGAVTYRIFTNGDHSLETFCRTPEKNFTATTAPD